MGLLKMGDDFMVDLNEVWISTVPEFRELLLRDRGNAKDGKARYKRKAHRDFTFLWLMYDIDSDLREEEAEEKFRLACDRTDRQPWQVEEDQVLQDAIKAYIKKQNDKSSALRTWTRMKEINDRGLAYLEAMDLNKTTAMGVPLHKYKELSDAIQAQPRVEKALDEILTLARKQLSDEVSLRGESEKGLDEDA